MQQLAAHLTIYGNQEDREVAYSNANTSNWFLAELMSNRYVSPDYVIEMYVSYINILYIRCNDA